MPVGVPKVPFQAEDEEDASWVDVYNRLYRQRALFLGDIVDSDLGNQIVGLMVYLTIEDSRKDQALFINSPGGWILPGIAIYDTIQGIPPDVYTVCIGVAASMGSLILVGGTATKRIAYPHARVMIHEPFCEFYDVKANDYLLETSEFMELYNRVVNAYVQRTGKPSWIICEDIKRDCFMSATEALAYGIVDLIGIEWL
uniref:ATP-dependent Clp protease proteolytic subunit n=1 Tax=Thevetia peruviana TaxID=52862 RepID=A0A2S1U7Q1_THEPV|nr:Clp protease proteolytic subunit [Thevetia peruviana]